MENNENIIQHNLTTVRSGAVTLENYWGDELKTSTCDI